MDFTTFFSFCPSLSLRITFMMLPSQGLWLDPGGHLPRCSRLFASFLKRSYRCAVLRFSGPLTLAMLQLFSFQTSLLKIPSILPTCTTQKLNLLKRPLSAGKHVAKWKQDIFMYTGRGLLSQAFKWTDGWRWHTRDIWREAAGIYRVCDRYLILENWGAGTFAAVACCFTMFMMWINSYPKETHKQQLFPSGIFSETLLI